MESKLTDTINKMSEGVKDFTTTTGLRVENLEDRLDTLESAKDRPRSGSKILTPEYKDFTGYLRSGESKAMTIGSDADGGAFVPEFIADEMLDKALGRGGLTSIVRKTKSETSDYVRLLNLRGQAASWVAEGGTRSVTDSFTVREIRPTHGEIYAAVQVSNWLLNDAKFDVAAMVLENAEAQFARSLETAVYSGDGSNKPTGITNTTPSESSDTSSPLRAQDEIERYNVLSGGDFSNALIGGYFRLAPEYRASASWLMSSATLSAVRQLRDSSGSGFLWQPNLGVPVDNSDGTLLGKQVYLMEDMGTASSSPVVDSVIVGDFKQGYELVQISGLSVIRDEVSTRGHTIFYLSARFGGRIVDNDALKTVYF